MFLQFLDHLAIKLSDRLLNFEDRPSAQFLIPSKLENLTDDKIQSIYQTFQSDLTALDTNEFQSELLR